MKDNVLVVEDVPGYFEVEEAKLPVEIDRWRIKQYPGFLINFKGVRNLSSYLNSRFGRSSRYKLRREQKKLEKCFDISYRMYYGDITKEEYAFLFDELYKLLEIRSHEKGIKNNVNLLQRDFYEKIVYSMILEKKASLYVIYNGKMPIDICLNFHLNNVIFQYIRTYDIAYSKFNTGYTDLMKHIEWCIANDIKLISFSKGDFYWKRRWCNTVYDYEYHIFFRTNSLGARIKAGIFWGKRKLRQFLREKKVIEWYHAKREKFIRPESETSRFKISKIDLSTDLGKMVKIDYNEAGFRFLRRPVFDFLYEVELKENEIQTFQIENQPSTFLIEGREESVLVHCSDYVLS